MSTHSEFLAEAQKLTSDNPELHVEYMRRRGAGEFFRKGEPVTKYWKKLVALNNKALRAAGV